MDTPGIVPHLFVVLGGTGDLMKRKLLPSLYRLAAQEKIPAGTIVLGVARHPLDDAAFQEASWGALQADQVAPDDALRTYCRQSLVYHQLAGETPEEYAKLLAKITELEGQHHLSGDRVFYLALPQEAVASAIRGLGGAKMNQSPGWTRVVIEKPFGRDLASAQELNRLVHQFFDEKQIFRIDHYLGKETVQNLLVFRFANMFVESLWNRQRVEHVEITVAEHVGVEGRANYYESLGALRDMIQNHVTQLLTLIAMEPPARRDEDSIRNEKVKVLRSTARIRPEDVVRGQYSAGTIDGKPVPGYREEPGVSPTSQTDTYVALRLKVANWRWQDVPFFIRTGKRLPTKTSRVVVTFKAPPVSFFQTEADYEANPDRLTILIEPKEGFELAFEVKVPGREIKVQTHRMQFHYADVFGTLPDGYETLLTDVMLGDSTLFVRADEVEESWRLYAPILENPPPVTYYPAGSWGPQEAQDLVQQWGHRWNPD